MFGPDSFQSIATTSPDVLSGEEELSASGPASRALTPMGLTHSPAPSIGSLGFPESARISPADGVHIPPLPMEEVKQNNDGAFGVVAFLLGFTRSLTVVGTPAVLGHAEHKPTLLVEVQSFYACVQRSYMLCDRSNQCPLLLPLCQILFSHRQIRVTTVARPSQCCSCICLFTLPGCYR
jgi:hypothetical protein